MTSDPTGLAQELHDGIAQDLAGLGYSIDSLIAQEINNKNRAELRAVRLCISDLIEKVRLEIFHLRNAQPIHTKSASTGTEYEMQRVFGEILRNVTQHAQASSLHISVTDNGIGGAHHKAGSFGIKGIQERVASLNGDIQIESTENGTRIEVTIPLDR